MVLSAGSLRNPALPNYVQNILFKFYNIIFELIIFYRSYE